jgi:inosine-uridine nucleoside N-ribohydrolase
VRLWVDTDVGDDPDDVVALLCAAAHPDVELVGVSTVPGVPRVQPDLARALVDAPVHPGEDGAAMVAAFRAAAPEALLAIGPLAGVAALLETGVDLPDLTVMGGALTPVVHRGRRLVAEHNFESQPAAASAVIAGAEALLVPLDTTRSMRVSPEDLERVVRAVPVLDREVSAWFERRRAMGVRDDDLALILHDPLALLVCARDPAARVERDTRSIAVDARTGVVRAVDDGRAHDVVVSVDAPRAVARVLALLGV